MSWYFEQQNGLIKAVLPVPPFTNRWLMPIRNRMVKTQAHRDYRELIELMMIQAKLKPFVDEVSMKSIWYRARRKGDIDAYEKALLDSLQAASIQGFGCYLNDHQISEHHKIRLDTDPKNPRIYLEIKRCIQEEINNES